jgi:hypothetical protein
MQQCQSGNQALNIDIAETPLMAVGDQDAEPHPHDVALVLLLPVGEHGGLR